MEMIPKVIPIQYGNNQYNNHQKTGFRDKKKDSESFKKILSETMEKIK